MYNNLIAYSLGQSTLPSLEELSKSLEANKFIPCTPEKFSSIGFVQPLVSDPERRLVHDFEKSLFLRIEKQKKVIPAEEIEKRLEERVEEFRKRMKEEPSKSDLTDMKEILAKELVKTAYSKYSTVDFFINLSEKYLVINASSGAVADAVVKLLRTSVTGLELNKIKLEKDLSYEMSKWVKSSELPNHFSFGHACKLESDSGAGITAEKHEIDCDEIKTHIQTGKSVVSLELNWENRILFTLNDKFQIKKIKGTSIYKTDVNEATNDGESDEEDDFHSFKTSCIMMSKDLSKLITDVVNFE